MIGVYEIIKKDSKQYFIKDDRNGTGLFIKIQERYFLEHDYIFSFGKTHILVKKVQYDNKLKLKILNEDLKERYKKFNYFSSYSFYPCVNKEIRLGRKKGIEIMCNDEDMSRIQCTY